MASTHKDLRIVLFGKTASGKSATGNNILGKDVFKVSDSLESVTKMCSSRESTVGEASIKIIDTPGLCDTSSTDNQMLEEMEKCMKMSAPGPHVFLLVIRLDVPHTEEEKNPVKWIQENFGEKASKYVFIVFTHADHLEGRDLDKYVGRSNVLQVLTDSCGGRFHSVNNKDVETRSQVTELLEKIEKMVEENGGEHYSAELFKEAQENIQMLSIIQSTKKYGKTALMIIGGGVAVVALAPAVGPILIGGVQAAMGPIITKYTLGVATAGIASVVAWSKKTKA